MNFDEIEEKTTMAKEPTQPYDIAYKEVAALMDAVARMETKLDYFLSSEYRKDNPVAEVVRQTELSRYLTDYMTLAAAVSQVTRDINLMCDYLAIDK